MHFWCVMNIINSCVEIFMGSSLLSLSDTTIVLFCYFITINPHKCRSFNPQWLCMVTTTGVDGVGSLVSYGSHFYNRLSLLIANYWYLVSGWGFEEVADYIVGSMLNVVLLHSFGYDCGLWKILHIVDHMFGPFVGVTYLAVPVIFHGMTKIPSILSMGFPWWVVIHIFMDVYSGLWIFHRV